MFKEQKQAHELEALCRTETQVVDKTGGVSGGQSMYDL